MPLGIKPGRLDGQKLSFHEVNSGITYTKNKINGRILLGLDDLDDFVIIDGRHLLHAYLLLDLLIPNKVIGFVSHKIRKKFIFCLDQGSVTS